MQIVNLLNWFHLPKRACSFCTIDRKANFGWLVVLDRYGLALKRFITSIISYVVKLIMQFLMVKTFV